MSDGNIEVALARIEGKMDVITEKLNHSDAEMSTVRTRLHELANHVAAINALNLQAALRDHSDRLEKHSQALITLDRESSERKGGTNALKLVWAVAGAAGTMFVALVSVAIRYYTGG